MFNYKGITKDKTSWKFGSNIIKSNNDYVYICNDCSIENTHCASICGIVWDFKSNDMRECIKETISISFGKFDRNNKEIFTNDIVKVPAGYCCDYFYKSTEAIVMFDDYEFFLWNKNDKHNITWQYFEWNQLEIIGNKFDYLIS